MLSKEKCRCRVCGLFQEPPPWGEDGLTPSFNICPCCGTEFGYDDATAIAIKAQRTRWLASGGQWFDPKRKPLNWSLKEQLEQGGLDEATVA